MREPARVEQAVEEPVREDRFPHERVVNFCDAVFAIVITLLAIELRLPGSELIERVGADQAWGETLGLLLSYLISFFVTGLFWVGHMLTWKHVRRVNGKLVWLALLQLFFVVLMPFATRQVSEHFVFYALVLTGISLFSWLVRRAVVAQEDLRAKLGPAQARLLLARGLVPLLVFSSAVPLGLFVPGKWAVLVFALIFPLSLIARRRILARGG
ncbi:TMEM175 family protein [Stenotrophomonas nitritireducens]|uniref:TMEM175 family protein n=1 Tax=Stenotrophomonas nitritireducens TaxID=83617 RepID=UPI003D954611